ncbi:hypothetical protein [Metabacillus endolithicus]
MSEVNLSMKEIWERWEPVHSFPKRIYLQSLIDNKNGLTLLFETGDDKTIAFNFDSGVLSYRNTDEGVLYQTLRDLDKEYGGEFYSNWSLFKVKNSSYLNWFKKEGCGKWDYQDDVKHYVFMTSDDVVEVLSNYLPLITL